MIYRFKNVVYKSEQKDFKFLTNSKKVKSAFTKFITWDIETVFVYSMGFSYWILSRHGLYLLTKITIQHKYKLDIELTVSKPKPVSEILT